ncbi:DNA-binding transcriptional regulator [Vogesella sp. AC12]|uniref:helix-turn-helix domain-containing protein n=1 Tax=Vogesella sp. AC12 TaxID=2950550 RepID=UPI00210C2604|nr:helix-turn-helix transcriptional regulator [Vogesella sp. AC12]MCQ4142813.1 helix-turn-helix domain-containing protein [Vogesella sp. AC12]
MSKTPRINYRDMRKSMGLNQQEFWSQVWVTQSGGSRYESGRAAPRQVAEQVRLRHELGIDTSLITADNAALIKAVLEGAKKGSGNERAD